MCTAVVNKRLAESNSEIDDIDSVEAQLWEVIEDTLDAWPIVMVNGVEDQELEEQIRQVASNGGANAVLQDGTRSGMACVYSTDYVSHARRLREEQRTRGRTRTITKE